MGGVWKVRARRWNDPSVAFPESGLFDGLCENVSVGTLLVLGGNK